MSIVCISNEDTCIQAQLQLHNRSCKKKGLSWLAIIQKSHASQMKEAWHVTLRLSIRAGGTRRRAARGSAWLYRQRSQLYRRPVRLYSMCGSLYRSGGSTATAERSKVGGKFSCAHIEFLFSLRRPEACREMECRKVSGVCMRATRLNRCISIAQQMGLLQIGSQSNSR